MLGTQRFFAFLVLTATVSITLSTSDQGNIFSRLFNQGKGFFSASSPSSSNTRSHSNSYPTQQQQAAKPKTASSRSWNVTSAASKEAPKAVSQARGYQSQGWGWPSQSHSHGDDYVYSHSTYGKGHQGVDINTLIGGLSLAGLLGVALFAFSRPSTTTIMMMNTTGRRRRSADEFEDDMMEGENLPEFLSRIGKYLEKSWTGEEETKPVEPFKLL